MTAAPPRRVDALLRSRLDEYRALLAGARSAGYALVSLEDWVRGGCATDHSVLILRHDVDQHPRSALQMAAVEAALGVRSTWYFRWRTAHPLVIGRLRRRGAHVGLHYETLSRLALQEGRAELEAGDIERGREALRAEIRAFAARHGQIRSICPHGDTRIPGVRNHLLLRGEDATRFGVDFDGNEIMTGRRLGRWLTDRPRKSGGWKDDADPGELLRDGVTPLFCVSHPHHWVSRLSALCDQSLRLTFGDRGRPGRPIFGLSDSPAP